MNTQTPQPLTHRRPAFLPAAALALATLWASSMGIANAADTQPTAAPARASANPLDKARSLVAAKDWHGALAELRRVNQTRSADWNNLMGYSLRKSANPDLAAAQSHYDTALRIEPTHRGALEYSGELFLMRGELALAEERATTLARVCQRCEELDDLRGAIERYKAAGNRWVAKP
jgi:hypothetical protein